MDNTPMLSLLIAHAGTGGTAILGFLHPLLGVDHLLAMLTVGMLSAQMGGRAIWTVPATFVLVMGAAGVAGFLGAPLPLVEYGIALSVVVLGTALVADQRVPEGVAMIFVGLFACFHGHAHGAELGTVRGAMDVVAYVLGFMVATAGLHVVGALLGYIALRSARGSLLLRLAGGPIAVIGVYLLAGV